MERKEALEMVRKALAGKPEFAEALEALSVVRSARAPKEPEFLAMFQKVGDKVTELEAFKRFKAGRKDLYWIIADAIKLIPFGRDARKWIEFDTATETYVLKGIGPVPPAGYNGYVPKAERPTSPAK